MGLGILTSFFWGGGAHVLCEPISREAQINQLVSLSVSPTYSLISSTGSLEGQSRGIQAFSRASIFSGLCSGKHPSQKATDSVGSSPSSPSSSSLLMSSPQPWGS